MPNIVPTARYYPKLSEVVTIEDLPEFLSFVQDGLNAIFEKIHYKNLQYSKSKNGDAAFYSLEIVGRKLAIPLPYDMALVLNPDLTGNNDAISSFPITLEYQWEILAFLKSFDLQGFSFTLEDFYTLGLKVFRISEDQVLAHILNYFVEPINSQTTKFEQFVLDFNSIFPNTPLTLPVLPSVNSVVGAVNALNIPNKNVPILLFGIYILDSDLDVTKNKLQQFYNVMVPEGIEAYIKKLIIPKAKATLALSAGIEFPEKILRPVEPNGNLIPNKKTTFVFAQAQLYADTEAGIGYQLELGGTLQPSTFAEIGKTGILIQIESLKLDLSKKTNIPEADEDGRSVDFTGVYARALSVTLPARWFHDEAVQGTPATTLRLGGYNLLIGTGGVSGTFMLETVASTITGGTTYYFEDKFNIQFPIIVLEKNNTTNAIEDVTVNDIGTLKTKLFPPTNTSISPASIKFPITLKELPLETGITKTFENIIDYQKYLNTLSVNGSIDAVPTMWKRLGQGGFRIGFNRFDITFKQNKVVNSNIRAMLEIPKLDQPIEIQGTLDSDYNTQIAA